MTKPSKTQGKNKLTKELNTIFTVMTREIIIFFKSPSTAIISLVMPIVMMGMIGGNMMQNMMGDFGFDLGEFMLVGMLVNMLFLITSMGMTSLVEDAGDFNQEMLVAPVSRYSLILGKILGSSFSATVSMFGTLIVGFFMGITLPINKLLLLLLLSPLISMSGGALAMMVLGLIKNKRTASLVVSYIVMPQMFLSGAIIPINNSSGILFILSRLMPMTYSLDLARAAVYAGTAEYHSAVMFNPIINFISISILTIVFLVVGTLFFTYTEKNK